ncbi:MAG: site-specific integrase [Pseudomonadota bacterium]
MLKHNPNNVRIKRQYFAYLKEAMRQSEASVDAVAKAIARFEAHTKHRDFKTFHYEQAIAFKKWLADQTSLMTGGKLSKATLHGTLSHLQRFFHWLAGQPGYKSRLRYSDADYFNVSGKDVRIATAHRSRPVPTLEQLQHVIRQMPATTEIERRNRALLAFAVLTGARDRAIASAKIKHVDLVSGSFYQDAREVQTKFSKTFITTFFPVGDDLSEIVADWVNYLRREKLWGGDDPLFPKPALTIGRSQQFEHVTLAREHWANASPIRAVFQQAFESAGLPYYNPHSLRHMLAQVGERVCRTPEQFKAWSQNLGHEGVLTTFFSYGGVSEGRQRELIRELGEMRL